MRPLCLITGASAGIGAAFAEEYAARGYDLAITARRADRLEALARDLTARHGATVLTLSADLADPSAPADLLGAVARKGRVVDALVNNAGYGLPGTFAASDWATHRDFLQVMVTSYCELAHGVWSGMLARRFGRVINVASLAGHLPSAAGHTMYAASKSFLIKFTQALHLEGAPHGVHATAVCPGFTLSEFHDVNGTRSIVSKLPKALWQSAADVARQGAEACERNQAVIVTGAPNKAIATLGKLLPDQVALAVMKSQGARFRRTDGG